MLSHQERRARELTKKTRRNVFPNDTIELLKTLLRIPLKYKLTASEIKILNYLGLKIIEENTWIVCASYTEIANHTNLSRRQVISTITFMEAEKIIRVRRKNKTTNIYKLNIAELSQHDLNGGEN